MLRHQFQSLTLGLTSALHIANAQNYKKSFIPRNYL